MYIHSVMRADKTLVLTLHLLASVTPLLQSLEDGLSQTLSRGRVLTRDEVTVNDDVRL